MGIFSMRKVVSSNDPFSRQEAFLAVALAVSAADGNIAESEIKRTIAYLSQMNIFNNCTERQLSDMFKKLFTVLEHEGINGLIMVAENNLPTRLRWAAFVCAVDIALADGVLEESEELLLEELQLVLGIPDELGRQIFEVMIVKNYQ